MADLTTINSALKQTWTEDRLAEQLYQDNPLLERVKKLKQTQVGAGAKTAVHVGRNWGYTAVAPSSTAATSLNAAGSQSLAQATWNYTHHHQQIKLEADAIDGTANDTLSVAQLVDTEVQFAVKDLNRQISRQLVLDGTGGFLAFGVTAASNTVVFNVASLTNAFERGWIQNAPSAAIGPNFDGGLPATPTARFNNRFFSSINAAAGTATISGAAVTTAVGDFGGFVGSRGASTSNELNGLQAIVSTSATLGGITTAAQPEWASPSVDSTSQALTLNLILTAQRKVFQKAGKFPQQLVTSPKQRANLYSLLQSQVRFAGDTGLNGGAVEKIAWNDMEVITLPDCKNEELYILTLDDLLLATAGDPYWINKVEGAGGPLRWAQGTDAFVSKITYRAQLGCRRRNTHAALTGLT